MQLRIFLYACLCAIQLKASLPPAAASAPSSASAAPKKLGLLRVHEALNITEHELHAFLSSDSYKQSCTNNLLHLWKESHFQMAENPDILNGQSFNAAHVQIVVAIAILNPKILQQPNPPKPAPKPFLKEVALKNPHCDPMLDLHDNHKAQGSKQDPQEAPAAFHHANQNQYPVDGTNAATYHHPIYAPVAQPQPYHKKEKRDQRTRKPNKKYAKDYVATSVKDDDDELMISDMSGNEDYISDDDRN